MKAWCFEYECSSYSDGDEDPVEFCIDDLLWLRSYLLSFIHFKVMDTRGAINFTVMPLVIWTVKDHINTWSLKWWMDHIWKVLNIFMCCLKRRRGRLYLFLFELLNWSVSGSYEMKHYWKTKEGEYEVPPPPHQTMGLSYATESTTVANRLLLALP